MRRDLDLALLRAFLAVVETGSVTGAARQLNRTQAAVSLQLKRLEEALGQSLFDREHKRLILAVQGERLVGEARRLIAMNDALYDRMVTPNFEGEVRLGVPVDIIVAYVPAILRRFAATWPGVRVSLVAKNSHDLLDDLASGDIDLTITTDLDSDGRAELLKTDDLVWVGAPGDTAHRRSPLPIAIGGKNCRFRPVIIEAVRKQGRDWRIVLQVANQDAVNATVAAGLCVGALLRESVPNSLEVLSSDAGLPALPAFRINLHMPATGGSDVAVELARHIRAEFASRAELAGESWPQNRAKDAKRRAGPRRTETAGMRRLSSRKHSASAR
jgi:DNA-binding transcriptional LysR family regulator